VKKDPKKNDYIGQSDCECQKSHTSIHKSCTVKKDPKKNDYIGQSDCECQRDDAER